MTREGERGGRDGVQRVRVDWGYGKGGRPGRVMTGDGNPHNQTGLLQAGANALVLKPFQELLLVTNVLF